MIDSLGNKGHCTDKSVFRILGVIGHFYNDVKFLEVNIWYFLPYESLLIVLNQHLSSLPCGESLRWLT